MSDNKPVIYANFINRRSIAAPVSIPIPNRVTINTDLRQISDSFDFEITYRLSDKVDLASHDFVEFYFMNGSERFQIMCGFVEDFVKETSSNTHKFQANGRDFMGQLFNLPFFLASPFKLTDLVALAKYATQDAYQAVYLATTPIKRRVVPNGCWAGPTNIPLLTDSKRAPILQSVCDDVYSVPYQNRFGQLVLWGRNSPAEFHTGLTLSEKSDQNVIKMVVRQNFSKVFSLVKALYTSGLNATDVANETGAKFAYNSEPLARHIIQPEIRTFQSSSLIATGGAVDFANGALKLAASIMRKSNQNLLQVVVSTSRPYFVGVDGVRTPYEKNQIWNISAPSYQVDRPMRLVGISYVQDEASLRVELMFIIIDSLI